MKPGIRGKLTLLIVLAVVAPLVVAIGSLQTLGYRQRVREKGAVFQAEASYLAEHLSLLSANQVDSLQDLIQLTDFARQLEAANQSHAVLGLPARRAQIEDLDQRWARLAPASAEVQVVLTNSLAGLLRVFQQSHTNFAEIMVTDGLGGLLAATGKTTDYDQSDENWWRQSVRLDRMQAWIEGFHMDESSGVFSLDVSVPVRRARGSSATEPALGAVKAVLNTTPLFASIRGLPSDAAVRREVVRADGRVLFRLLDEDFVRMTNQIPAAARGSFMSASQPGWTTSRLYGEEARMVGHAPLQLVGVFARDRDGVGQTLLSVLVHERTSVVLAPIRLQTLLLTAAGLVLVLGFTWMALALGRRQFVRPVELLRTAAYALAATARAREKGPGPANADAGSVEQAATALEQVARLRTGDELELLAGDFRTMAVRLLRYQEQLQAEIAAKTADIHQDLAIAREFQEALLPRRYPRVPSETESDPLCLQFHHVYKPTFSLSGDFFDVIKVGHHRAGILIADVMGHGTRSALITAILRTLLQDLARTANDPAEFLHRLNRHFHSIVHQTDQSVFVTACYVVVDTQEGTVDCASAGHPSPLIANRQTRCVEPIFERLKNNPALGLFPGSTYTVFNRSVLPGELVLLFTDGLLEAPNADFEEFGRDRLIEVLREHLREDIALLNASVVEAVTRFAGQTTLPDDLCLVAVEVLANSRRAAAVGHPQGVAGL